MLAHLYKVPGEKDQTSDPGGEVPKMGFHPAHLDS